MAWLVILLLPMLALVQTIAASVATVSRMSLQEAIARTYGRAPAILAAVAIVPISVCTLGADLQAGAQALALLTGASFTYFVVPLALCAGALLATQSYLKVERILAALALVFLCYVASAVLAHPDWSAVMRGILVPRFDASPAFVIGALALLGTTLTSYVYFWESVEVAERRPPPSQLRSVNSDAAVGMLVAGSTFLFILIATAATSGRHHTAIQTAADAALALKPLAGAWAQALFGIGLLASAAIAIPVIAATNGYVVAQTLAAPAGLTAKIGAAPAFYGVVFASIGLGAVVALLPVPTMPLLYWASVAAGVATPITLALTLLVARNTAAMRDRPISLWLACGGWLTTAVVTIAAIAFIVLEVKRIA